MSEVHKEPCEYCDMGWCEGRPEPTPDGPYYPSFPCTACDGHGWVQVEYEAFTEEDAIDRDAALAAMGEDAAGSEGEAEAPGRTPNKEDR